MKLPFTGGCQCGALRDKISDALIPTYTCHCTDCQRIAGTAFPLAIIVPGSGFRLTKGEPRPIERMTDSGRVDVRLLCRDRCCSIAGLGRPGEAGIVVHRVRAGTLDDRSWLQPTAHTRSKQPWVTLPGGDQIFEAQPG